MILFSFGRAVFVRWACQDMNVAEVNDNIKMNDNVKVCQEWKE